MWGMLYSSCQTKWSWGKDLLASTTALWNIHINHLPWLSQKIWPQKQSAIPLLILPKSDLSGSIIWQVLGEICCHLFGEHWTKSDPHSKMCSCKRKNGSRWFLTLLKSRVLRLQSFWSWSSKHNPNFWPNLLSQTSCDNEISRLMKRWIMCHHQFDFEKHWSSHLWRSGVMRNLWRHNDQINMLPQCSSENSEHMARQTIENPADEQPMWLTLPTMTLWWTGHLATSMDASTVTDQSAEQWTFACTDDVPI